MLISHPGSHQQMASACLDAGLARDIALMLADTRAVLEHLAGGRAPAAARQAAAALQDTASPYDLPALAAAVGEAEGMLRRAVCDALSGVPGHIPGS